jgi:alpha-beta hydrolase superfamily lysophospholipase
VALLIPDAPLHPLNLVEVPDRWNGTLLLFSHGYVLPGSDPVAGDAPDLTARSWLLDHGYALAGTSFRTSGWAVEEALQDQMQLLTIFRQRYGPPRRTIAWGGSMGGLISAALVEQHPSSFDGGLSMCGVMAGAVGSWNLRLDSAFAFSTLLAGAAALELVRVRDPTAELAMTRQVARQAETTGAGRARMTLAAALGDLPSWPGPVHDFYILRRAELERRAAGNPSWNIGVDYRAQLERSRYRGEVTKRYAEAGLDLESDLERLAQAPRIGADPKAMGYLSRNATLAGRLRVPFLTVHATTDDQVPVEHQQAYSRTVAAAGNGDLLRQLFVHRQGHCGVRPVEALVALQTLLDRLEGGRWSGLEPAEMNRRKVGLQDPAPSFTSFRPGPFLRPYPVS